MESLEELPDYLNFMTVSSLAESKRRLLEQSTSIPKFYITIEDYNITTSHTIYNLEYGILDPVKKEVKVYHTNTRYSKLLQLYEEVKAIYGTNNLPSFPGKKYYGNNTDSLAKQRISQMTPFIYTLNTLSYMSEKPVFRSIFTEFNKK